jgi:NitT/TauT family transport system ATP-binding protein
MQSGSNGGDDLALIELSEVGKIYRSLRGTDYQALRDFDLRIERGEFFCLLGTSGCGKTTVLNMVAGFEQQTAGRITVNGTALTGPGRDRGGVSGR